MKNKKKNVFIIVLLIIVVLPILLSFVKCDNSAVYGTDETRTQQELNYSRQVKKVNNSEDYINIDNNYQSIYFNTNNFSSKEKVTELFNMLIDYIIPLGNNVFVYPIYAIDTGTAYYVLAIWVELSQYSFDLRNIIVSFPYDGMSYEELFSITDTHYDTYEEIFYVNCNNTSWFIDNTGVTQDNISLMGETMPIGYANQLLYDYYSYQPFKTQQTPPPVTNEKSGIGLIFGIMGEGFISLTTAFVSLFSGLVPVFWNNGQPTLIMIIILAGVLVVLGFWGIDKLLTLFKVGIGGKKWKK